MPTALLAFTFAVSGLITGVLLSRRDTLRMLGVAAFVALCLVALRADVNWLITLAATVAVGFMGARSTRRRWTLLSAPVQNTIDVSDEVAAPVAQPTGGRERDPER